MRFNLRTTERARKVAKRLRALLAEDGIDTSQSRALDATARIYGYRDWQELAASAGKEGESPDDAACEPDLVARRRDQHVSVVQGLGVPAERAVAIVDALHPTRSAREPSRGELARIIADSIAAEGASDLHLFFGGEPRMGLRREYVREFPPYDAVTLRRIEQAFVPPGEYKADRIEPEPAHPQIQQLRLQASPLKGGAFFIARALYRQGVTIDAPEWPELEIPTPAEPGALTMPFSWVLAGLEGLGRDAWFPKGVGPAPEDRRTRYFGRPWLPDGTPWPLTDDGDPIFFVMQVNPRDLPAPARAAFGDDRLVLLFFDNDEGHVLRVDQDLPGGPAEFPGGPTDRPYGKWFDFHPSVAPTNFVRDRDYPYEDGDDAMLGHTLPKDVAGQVRALYQRHVEPGIGTDGLHGVRPDARTRARQRKDLEGAYGFKPRKELLDRWLALRCFAGDKIGGWPLWEQGSDWPTREGRTMVPLFQVSSWDPIHDGKGGVWGTGQVFMDPANPDDLEYVWSCD